MHQDEPGVGLETHKKGSRTERKPIRFIPLHVRNVLPPEHIIHRTTELSKAIKALPRWTPGDPRLKAVGRAHSEVRDL